MQIIESGLFTILIPDKGYKLVNKSNGMCSKKVYLGKLDSPDNYGEIVDEKYVNMDFVVELDGLKEDYKKSSEQNELDTDLLLMVVDSMYNMFEPLMAMMPMTLAETEEENPQETIFIKFYVQMVKRGLKTIEEVPARFMERVRERM
jgi:hypothetical protein